MKLIITWIVQWSWYLISLVPVEVQENGVRLLALTWLTLTSSAPPLGGLTPSVASEGVVEPLMLGLVIQYPTHQMVVPTHKMFMTTGARVTEIILIIVDQYWTHACDSGTGFYPWGHLTAVPTPTYDIRLIFPITDTLGHSLLSTIWDKSFIGELYYFTSNSLCIVDNNTENTLLKGQWKSVVAIQLDLMEQSYWLSKWLDFLRSKSSCCDEEKVPRLVYLRTWQSKLHVMIVMTVLRNHTILL